MDLNPDGNATYLLLRIHLQIIWLRSDNKDTASNAVDMLFRRQNICRYCTENARILPAITIGQIFLIFLTMNWYKPGKN